MSATHTPGPWLWTTMGNGSAMLMANHSGRPVVLSARRKGMNSATIEVKSRGAVPLLVPVEEEPDHPDLHLIAAAPDLLSAAERLLEYLDQDVAGQRDNTITHGTRGRADELRDAIAIARGAR